MLAKIETEILDIIRADSLSKFLRQVDTLPVLDGENLVKRFGVDSPAVYFVMGDFPVADRNASLKGALVAVSRNATGHNEAKRGDGKIIGLYQMMDRLLALFASASTESANWKVTGGDFMQHEEMFKAGVYVGVVRIETLAPVELDPSLDVSTLDDFKTFAADYDLQPHEPKSEHNKWLDSPPDHSSSKPDLADVVQVQP